MHGRKIHREYPRDAAKCYARREVTCAIPAGRAHKSTLCTPRYRLKSFPISVVQYYRARAPRCCREYAVPLLGKHAYQTSGLALLARIASAFRGELI